MAKGDERRRPQPDQRRRTGTRLQAIFNADDFGRSVEINAAVERAHRHGILTSASLMVGAGAADDAVQRARALPSLAVGLHAVLCDGPSLLQPAEIPRLVDERGRLLDDPARLGVRCFFDPRARREVRRELQAQLERFKQTGLGLSHVDGHVHMHMHPTVLRVLLPLAARYGARGIRLPRDDIRCALQHSRRRAAAKVGWALGFRALCLGQTRRLDRLGLRYADVVYGLMQTGEMSVKYVTAVLAKTKARSCELYFHPSISESATPLGPNQGDLQTLLSPVVKDTIEKRGIEPASYVTLGSNRS